MFNRLIVLKMSKKSSNYNLLGYGKIPYFIIRECSGIYRQIPIHFCKKELQTKDGIYIEVDENDSYERIQEKCLNTLKDLIQDKIAPITQIENKQQWFFIGKPKKEGCLVIDPEKAIYLNSKGQVIAISEIPFGGTLISISGDKIRTNEGHYKLY